MTEEMFEEKIVPPVFQGFDALEALFPSGGPEEDLTTCFVCMRWTAGYPDCRLGNKCDLQPALDTT